MVNADVIATFAKRRESVEEPVTIRFLHHTLEDALLHLHTETGEKFVHLHSSPIIGDIVGNQQEGIAFYRMTTSTCTATLFPPSHVDATQIMGEVLLPIEQLGLAIHTSQNRAYG